MKLRSRIRVHLKSGRTIDGVLLSKRRGVLTLGDARVENKASGEQEPTLGLVFIDRGDVEFVQSGWVAS